MSGVQALPSAPARFVLRSERLGPLPLINHFIERIGLAELLACHVPSDARCNIPHAQALGVLLRSLIVQREPIYRQQETVDGFAGSMVPGAPAADAPVLDAGRKGWLLRHIGADFTLLVFGDAPEWAARLPLQTVVVGASGLHDAEGWATRRYDAQPGTAYLLRPDQHVCARWRTPTQALVTQALRRAQAQAN